MPDARVDKSSRMAPDSLRGNNCQLPSDGFHLAFTLELGLLSRKFIPRRVQ